MESRHWTLIGRGKLLLEWTEFLISLLPFSEIAIGDNLIASLAPWDPSSAISLLALWQTNSFTRDSINAQLVSEGIALKNVIRFRQGGALILNLDTLRSES